MIPAGDFSEWLHSTETSLRAGQGSADVPCGDCTACCRSSMFIHIRPEEKRTIQRIPRPLLFPAPGCPKGHVLMGYSDKGHCPMLAGDECSIYKDRPQTCRDYDCRIFAATGIPVEDSQPDIAACVRAWGFSYRSKESREQQQRIKEAATFLMENQTLFPPGALPQQPAQLAVLAIRVYKLFSARQRMPHAAISQAILQALNV